LKQALLLIAIILSLNLGAKTFVREYTYKAGEADSKLSARAIALEQVKRLLLEEVGLYIQSSFISKETEANGLVSSINETDIQVLSAGITKTTVLEESWNGDVYKLKAEIKLDEKDVLNRLDDFVNNTKQKQMLEENMATANTVLAELERLKTELATEKDKNLQMQLQEAYVAEAGKLNALEYYEKGTDITNRDSGDFASAAKWFQKAVDADSTLVDAWFQLGLCHFFTDNYGLAKQCLQTAYDLGGDPYALKWIGYCYSGLKDYSTALAYLQRSYDESGDLETLCAIGEVYYHAANYEKSREIYESVLAMDPDNFSATNFVTLSYLELQEYDKAVACYTKLIELGADPASQYSSIASAYERKGDFASSQKYYLMSLELEPDASYNWSYLADVSYRNNDFTQAIKALNKLLVFNPNDGWVEYRLGACYESINDSVNSRKYYTLAAKHGNEPSRNWCTVNNITW
jgi:tetratricopeptide (TPR) repeat protein